MIAAQARSLAERWLAEERARAPTDVSCAFIGGSLAEMADADRFPASSDVDLVIGVPTFDPERHLPRKRGYRGLFIEVCYVPRDRLLSPEAMLGDFALGPQAMAAKVLFDPDGALAKLRAALAPQFARRAWIRRRCQTLRAHALSLIDAFAASDSLAYLCGVALHVVRCLAQTALLAALRNPTVKKALLRSRDVLADYGKPRENDGLLRAVGLASLGAEDILTVSAHCRRALVEACRWLRTPFPGSNGVSEHAEAFLDLDVPAAVAGGGGRELFVWVASLYAYVMIALANDAPAEVARAAAESYRADLARLGLGSTAEARGRMLGCRAVADHMVEVCDDIVKRNPRALD